MNTLPGLSVETRNGVSAHSRTPGVTLQRMAHNTLHVPQFLGGSHSHQAHQ